MLRQLSYLRRNAGLIFYRPQRRTIHQFERSRSCFAQGRNGLACRMQIWKQKQARVLDGRSGTVSRTASAINASVPSDPISRWLKISTGSE